MQEVLLDNSNQCVDQFCKDKFSNEYVQSFKSDLDDRILVQPIRHNQCIFDKSQHLIMNQCPVCKQQDAKLVFDVVLFTILASSPGNMNILYQKQKDGSFKISYTSSCPTKEMKASENSEQVAQVIYSKTENIAAMQRQLQNTSYGGIVYDKKTFLNTRLDEIVNRNSVILLLNQEMKYDTLAFQLLQKKQLIRREIEPALSANAQIQINPKSNFFSLKILDGNILYQIDNIQLQTEGKIKLQEVKGLSKHPVLSAIANPIYVAEDVFIDQEKIEVISLDKEGRVIRQSIMVVRNNYMPVVSGGILYLYGGENQFGLCTPMEIIYLNSKQQSIIVQGPPTEFVMDLCFNMGDRLLYCSTFELNSTRTQVRIVEFDVYDQKLEVKSYQVARKETLNMRFVCNFQVLYELTKNKSLERMSIPVMLFQIGDQGVGSISVDQKQRIVHIGRII